MEPLQPLPQLACEEGVGHRPQCRDPTVISHRD
jgi:hypothetical protein